MKTKLSAIGILAGFLFVVSQSVDCQSPSRLIRSELRDVELPAHSLGDDIIRHTAYTFKYNEECEQADWVAYILSAEEVQGTHPRTDDFRHDPMVTTGSAELSDYQGSGFDRGHLAPAGDMKWSATAMSESFYMSNMSPQRPAFNRGIWKKLEEQVRAWATENGEILVVTGPVLSENLPTVGTNKVAIPEYFYKVIVDAKEPGVKGIGFVLANQGSQKPLEAFAVTIDSVETLTGIDFFPALPDEWEKP